LLVSPRRIRFKMMPSVAARGMESSYSNQRRNKVASAR
jgi:hypothetical protein